MDGVQFNEFRLQELITRREGMIAENLHRVYLGGPLAYMEDSFAILADEIRNFASNR